MLIGADRACISAATGGQGLRDLLSGDALEAKVAGYHHNLCGAMLICMSHIAFAVYHAVFLNVLESFSAHLESWLANDLYTLCYSPAAAPML